MSAKDVLHLRETFPFSWIFILFKPPRQIMQVGPMSVEIAFYEVVGYSFL